MVRKKHLNNNYYNKRLLEIKAEHFAYILDVTSAAGVFWISTPDVFFMQESYLLKSAWNISGTTFLKAQTSCWNSQIKPKEPYGFFKQFPPTRLLPSASPCQVLCAYCTISS